MVDGGGGTEQDAGRMNMLGSSFRATGQCVRKPSTRTCGPVMLRKSSDSDRKGARVRRCRTSVGRNGDAISSSREGSTGETILQTEDPSLVKISL